MALLSAEREGDRYLNPVLTEVGGLSLMLKVGPFHPGPRAYSTRSCRGYIGHGQKSARTTNTVWSRFV